MNGSRPHRLPDPPVLFITDRRQSGRPLPEIVAEIIQGGIRWVSLREKDLRPDVRRDLLLELREIAAPSATVLMVHDDVEAAAGLGLAGVHLPAAGDPTTARNHLGKSPLIGISAHSLTDIQRAMDADYVTLSPIFPTESKPGYGPFIGLDGLARTARESSLPILALGGIDIGNAEACLDAGAAGLAVMGTLIRAPEPGQVAEKLVQAVRKVRPA